LFVGLTGLESGDLTNERTNEPKGPKERTNERTNQKNEREEERKDLSRDKPDFERRKADKQENEEIKVSIALSLSLFSDYPFCAGQNRERILARPFSLHRDFSFSWSKKKESGRLLLPPRLSHAFTL
jgi:hypothetical protein